MTTKRALELSIELWTWLRDNPEKLKADWPGWTRNGGSHSRIMSDCFLCDITLTCQNCVLHSKWGFNLKHKVATCNSTASIYSVWLKAGIDLKYASGVSAYQDALKTRRHAATALIRRLTHALKSCSDSETTV